MALYARATMATPEHADLTAPDGTRIRRWRRGPPDAAEAVCFVHGATYGGRSAFDPDGVSWLEAVASAGRAAYAVDVRGYGDSERPPELDPPPEENEPIVRASTAAGDVAASLSDLHDAHEAIHLVGYSWGTIIAGVALAEEGVDVDSLVQYAPVFRPPGSHRQRFDEAGQTTAYRRVTWEEARSRWADQRPEGDVPGDAFAAFWDALVASGQRVDDEGDDAIVAPNGTLVDLRAAIDGPPYDPVAVDVPALVVRGSHDTASTREDALGLYESLGGADRSYVEIAGGTHFLQFESNRETLYATVRGFHDRIA